MPTLKIRIRLPRLGSEFGEYLGFLIRYTRYRGYFWFSKFEVIKDLLVDLLYQKRGKYVRPFLHVGTVGLVFLMVTIGPVVFASNEEESGPTGSSLLSLSNDGSNLYTIQAEEVRQFRGGEIIIHSVQEGETVSSIAQRYGLQPTTILWENNLDEKAKLKPGQELKILPVDGVRHKVSRGETIYSIGKKYGLDGSEVQVIVDYPFNEFLNSETFELATGQQLMIPDGRPPVVAATVPRANIRVTTPNAGAVSPTGQFVWPAAGLITQRYSFYHKAWDIANRGAGPILAADSGTVIVAGWPDNSGYGNRVMIDHGNGYVTLYAHLSLIQVQQGQTVNKGNVIGQMGTTGRSTGIHLHFEIRKNGTPLDPGQFLR